jgi:two-component system, LytTR family, sensor kinase
MKAMRFFSPVRPLLKGWLLSLLGWGAFFLALGWQLSHAFQVPWTGVFQMLGRDALVWAFLTPLIFRLVDRLPLERGRWKVALPVHVAVCLVVLLGFSAMAQAFAHGPMPSPKAGESPREAGPPPRRGWSIGWLLFGPQLPVYLALVSVAHARYYSRRSAERERRSLELAASLADARLQALRMQIQPHFLFNSLNALAALIHKDPEAADEMLSALSEFLRLTLEDSGGQEVALRRELEFVERYLAIEKVRFGPRLEYSVEVEPELLGGLVPALLLQPLVENAVRHGVEPRREGGRIDIRVSRHDGGLRLIVWDNGVGITISPTEGVGLANTRARLRELYSDAGSLSWRSEEGTEVEIRVPWHVA